MGRLVKETNPLHLAHRTAYDKAGNRISTTDGNGNTTVYAYDGLNRLTATTDPEGAISGNTRGRFFCVLGRLTWDKLQISPILSV